jgi:hypothetical protein
MMKEAARIDNHSTLCFFGISSLFSEVCFIPQIEEVLKHITVYFSKSSIKEHMIRNQSLYSHNSIPVG